MPTVKGRHSPEGLPHGHKLPSKSNTKTVSPSQGKTVMNADSKPRGALGTQTNQNYASKPVNMPKSKHTS